MMNGMEWNGMNGMDEWMNGMNGMEWNGGMSGVE